MSIAGMWCELNRRHYLGIANSLEVMRTADDEAYEALKRALHFGAQSSDVEAVVRIIAGSRPL
jgi:hypothetical protein